MLSLAYNDFVGCGHAIQNPYGKGMPTDLRPCLLAPDTLIGLSITNNIFVRF